MEVRGTFEIRNWDEKPYQEIEGGGKLTRASVERSFSGDIKGDSRAEYLMMYRADGTAEFVAMERFVGRIANRTGSVVFRHNGIFDGAIAKDKWSIVTGSGTDELEGITGELDFAAGHEKSYPITLHCEFDSKSQKAAGERKQ